MAVGLAWYEHTVDVLLQPDCLRAALPPIHLSASGRSRPIDLHLEPGQPVDPPIPPSLAFRLVDQFIPLPDELPEEDARPPLIFTGRSAGAPSLPPLR